MKVLHVIDKLSMDRTNPSSCAILLAQWSKHLVDGRDFDLSVCTLRGDDPGGHYLEQKGIRVHYLRFGKFSPRNIGGILRLIRQEKPQILHLHGYSAANFGRLAARRAGIINVVHEHSALKLLPHQYMVDLLLRSLTDCAVAVSANVRDFMIRVRNIPDERIRLVPNGVDLAEFGPGAVADIIAKKQELGLSGHLRIVGTVTRLRTEKGTEFLIRAVPHLLKQCPDVVFLIVGDGPLKSSLEQLATDLGVRDSIRFIGFRSDIRELLQVFDVNVIPSLTEGFPLCFIEAMAAGNPIVASAVGAIRDIADDGHTALLVPPTDSVQLAQKICYVIKTPEVARRLSLAARQASRKFDAGVSAGVLRDLYTELAGRAHA